MNDKLDIQSTSNDFTYELDNEKNELNYELDNLYVFDISKYQKEQLDINATTEKQTFIPREGYLYDKVIVNAVDKTIDSNIKADNIRKGVSILGVDGIVEKLPYQEKTIEPTTSEQLVTADDGYDLSSVIIKPVTSDIDENIKPENIKKDVNVLGVTGTMKADMLQKLIDGRNNCFRLFYNSTDINVDYISELDTSNITSMEGMFYKCSKLETIPQLNTSSVTSMYDMFYFCSSLKTIPQLDTSKVNTMYDMFYQCKNLETIPQLNTSNVTNMSNMFYNCAKLTTIPQLDTSSVTNMYQMFEYCSSLKTIPQLNTNKVTNMDYMFYRCSSLTSIPHLNTSKVTNMSSMFNSCTSLIEVPQLNISNATNISSMFNFCRSLKTIPTLDLIKKPNTNYIFKDCYKLENLTLKNIQKTIQIGSGTSWGHLLTLDSLLNTIKELWDMSSSSSQTLTIGSANLTKLANVYVKLIDITDEMCAEDTYIDNKKPFVVCESTDDGAMLITDYARTLKNWNIN